MWEWDGTAWAHRAPVGTIPLQHHVMAYHGGTERMVALDPRRGGTWEYYTTEPASLVPFGAGCGGVAGVPALAAAPFSRPWVDDLLRLELTLVPPSSSTSLLLGVSNAQWGSAMLPFDLGGLNMPGCVLYTSVEIVLGATAIGGTATWRLPIPAVAAGATFYSQAMVLDPTANPLGVGMSNAATAEVGRR